MIGMIVYVFENDYVIGVLNGVVLEIVMNECFIKEYVGVLWRFVIFLIFVFVVDFIFG